MTKEGKEVSQLLNEAAEIYQIHEHVLKPEYREPSEMAILKIAEILQKQHADNTMSQNLEYIGSQLEEKL